MKDVPVAFIGVLGAGVAATLDERATLRTIGFELRWWVSAGERWYQPDEGAAAPDSAAPVILRHERPAGTPVVHSALRIPGGDVRVVCWAAVVDGADWIVLDVRNDSRIPVGFAAVVSAPPGAPGSWSLDGDVLSFGGAVATVAPRSADGWAAAADVATLAADVRAGRLALADPAGPHGPVTRTDLRGGAVVQVFAVAHTTGIRLLVAPDRLRRGDVGVRPAMAPSDEAVTRGWRKQIDAAARFDLGDDVLETAARRRRVDLLLDRGAQQPDVVRALAAFGHGEEAAHRLDAALAPLRPPVDPTEAVALLVAMADLVRWSTDGPELASVLTGPALELTAWLGRHDRGVADWAVGEIAMRSPHRGAADIATGSRPAVQRSAAGPQAAGPRPAAAPMVPADDDPDAAGALLALRRVLVDDDVDGVLLLLPGWQHGWRGRPLDVHGLPTAAGPLSFALRWHGARPALLWQLDDGPRPGARPPSLRCPTLDASFGTEHPRGEALLGPVPGMASGGAR